jgi:hypothetical protein
LATPATDEDDNNSDHNNEKMESGGDEADEVNEMNNNIKIDKGKGKAVDYGDINDDANSNSSLEMPNAAAVPHQINIPEDKMYDWEANPISAFCKWYLLFIHPYASQIVHCLFCSRFIRSCPASALHLPHVFHAPSSPQG